MADFLWLAAGLLAIISLSVIHPPIADVHSGIKLQECDAGTSTVCDGMEKRKILLIPFAQDAIPLVNYMWANRRLVYCNTKSHHVQARRRMKVWSRSKAMVIILLLLLSGDVEINPGPETDVSGVSHTGMIREDPPGVPLYHVPVSEVSDLERGDHILYQVCQESYSACYRSALVLTVEERRIHVVMNSSNGVKKEQIDSFENLYLIKYSHCYSSDEAIRRAMQRLNWNENCYHCLYNNSHHFVTLAKTGRENPLTEIVESLMHQGDIFPLTPVLTKVEVSNVIDVSEGDHIMTGTQHFLIASTDSEQNTYTGYTCREGKIVKEVCSWKPNAYNICIKYEESFSPRKALANAEKEIDEVAVWSDSDKKQSDKAIKFSDSESFVTKMKTGRKHSFNEHCIFSEKNEFSSTKITPEVAIDEGDHLMVKDENGNFQSVLVLKHACESELIVMPDLTYTEQYGTLDIKKYTEVFRINYKESLPVDDVFRRVMSERGREVLQACGGGSSQFVSWAKTGKRELIDVLQLKQQIAQVCPLQREKILSVEDIKVGDHLIKAYPTHWWHFMITESHKPDSSKFKTIYCYRNRISESEETLDPTKDDIYRVIYPESLPVATAIERARSKVDKTRVSFLGRMWFVRWAKTGSDDGIEIDFLLNNAMPASKSRICSFAQLNPGDYLVEKAGLWHHYLVTEVRSPTCCSVIASCQRRVTTSNLTFRESKKSPYYRINYSDGACIPPSQAIAKAQELDGKAIISPFKYTRRKFVNYIKTGNATDIEIDGLQDDRILLRRERVQSTLQLRPGDHIERPVPYTLKAAYHHMMVVDTPADERKCTVIHFNLKQSWTHPVKDEIDIVSQGGNFFRIKYPERHVPERGIEYLTECVEYNQDLKTSKGLTQEMEMETVEAPQIRPTHSYSLRSNNCEHLIMNATVGDELSIQVEESVHKALQCGTAAIICAGATLGKTLNTFHVHAAGAAVHTGAKVAAKVSAKTAAKAGAKGGAKAGAVSAGAEATAESLFQVGFRTALSGSAIGLTAGVAVAVNLAIEGPLLARTVYKLHRKEKFGHISRAQFEQGVIKESVTSASTVAGAVGGTIVGQVAIPVPILGAAIGGAVGGIAGQGFGRLEGWGASKLFAQRVVTLAYLETPTLIDNPPPTY